MKNEELLSTRSGRIYSVTSHLPYCVAHTLHRNYFTLTFEIVIVTCIWEFGTSSSSPSTSSLLFWKEAFIIMTPTIMSSSWPFPLNSHLLQYKLDLYTGFVGIINNHILIVLQLARWLPWYDTLIVLVFSVRGLH